VATPAPSSALLTRGTWGRGLTPARDVTPCGDLWNLLPSHRPVNQRKWDRMLSEVLLRCAGDSIAEWWRAGYLSRHDPILPHRFGEGAKASLPALSANPGAPETDEVLFAMGLQRLRLFHDQQVPEWAG
jgi:hypothetical protein